MASNKQQYCGGCRNDYYNRPGNSDTGDCWSLETAKVVNRTRVGWWEKPPYKWKPVKTLDCYHTPGVYAWLPREDVRISAPKKTGGSS